MNLLQQAFTVEVDFKQLIPSVTEFNGFTIIQYDFGNQHIKFELTDEQLSDPITYQLVRNKVKHWVVKTRL